MLKRTIQTITWPIATIYVAFFGLIAAATFFTGSANCLWALLLTPDVKVGKNKEND